MKRIKTNIILVASYVINVCNFTKKQLDELDKVIKQELRKAKMHGIQASQYDCIWAWRWGVKSVTFLYEDTKNRVARYMAYQETKWIHAA